MDMNDLLYTELVNNNLKKFDEALESILLALEKAGTRGRSLCKAFTIDSWRRQLPLRSDSPNRAEKQLKDEIYGHSNMKNQQRNSLVPWATN